MLLGTGTVYETQSLSGWWDLPGQRGDNTPLSSRHGSYPSPKYSEDREVVFEFELNTDPEDVADVINTLRLITAPSETPGEETLAVRLDGLTLQTSAALINRAIPTGRNYGLGVKVGGALGWLASDPRLYSIDEQVVTISLPVAAEGGLDFGTGGLDFGTGGLDFDVGPQGGSGTASNDGHVPTWPIFEIVGPVEGAAITYPNGRVLAFDPGYDVTDGQTLTIDTQLMTVEINGVSVRQKLLVGQWTPLYPGDNLLRFSATSYSAGFLRVRYRHAYH